MKNKLLISAILIASCSVNAGKIIAPGVELIEERTWVEGNATGHSVDTTGHFFLGANVSALTSSVNGRIGQNVSMQSSHVVNLHNESRAGQRYTTHFSICTSSSCTRQSRTFALDGGIDYTTSGYLYLTTTFYQVGSYDIEAKTEVTGGANANDIARSTAVISR